MVESSGAFQRSVTSPSPAPAASPFGRRGLTPATVTATVSAGAATAAPSRVKAWRTSASPTATPVTVTVCGTCVLPWAKRRVGGLTVAFAGSLLSSVTVPARAPFIATVQVAVPPFLTLTPVSLMNSAGVSRFITVTVAGSDHGLEPASLYDCTWNTSPVPSR